MRHFQTYYGLVIAVCIFIVTKNARCDEVFATRVNGTVYSLIILDSRKDLAMAALKKAFKASGQKGVLDCDSLIDMPVGAGTGGGAHAFGAMCMLHQKKSALKRVLICDDREAWESDLGPEAFSMNEIPSFPYISTLEDLEKYVVSNCKG